MNRSRGLTGLILGAIPLCWPVLLWAQNPTITVEATTPYGTIPHSAVGANHLWMDAACGTINTNDLTLKAGCVGAMNQMALGSIRWPCGTRANLFRWKNAIGPVSSRVKIPLGDDDGGYSSKLCYSGPDEIGRLREVTGADIAVLVNCATGNAEEAADLVEYMNAPAGTNPRGGIAWADVRAANGHPAPYGMKYWEIGNEYNLAGQNYWLDPLWSNRTAYAQAYALGGSASWISNGVVTLSDFSTNAMIANGKTNQVKFARFPPVDSTQPFTLFVGGQEWTCVTNLTSYYSTSQVYLLDFPTGKIDFGDGIHGACPANGAEIRLSYTCGRHDGFADYYREMKAVDPAIKIYSCVNWPEFCDTMGTNHSYDGLVKHLYPALKIPITVADSAVAWAHRVTSPQYYFLGTVLTNYAFMANGAQGLARHMDVVMTEYGVPLLDITAPDPGEQLDGSPLRDAIWYALLMQAGSAYGMPLIMKHMLIDNDGVSAERKQVMFHLGTNFVLGAAGHAFAQVARLKDKQLLACWTANNPVAATHATFGSRQALQVTAARDTAGALWLLVINVDRYTDYLTTINPLRFVSTGTASVWTVTGAYDWSNNWDTHTNDVGTTFQTISVPTGAFEYTFPKHSLTVLQLPQALVTGAWQELRSYAFTSASTSSNAWYPAGSQWWLAGKSQALNIASLDPDAGYALMLAGEDPSHGRATLTLGSSHTNGVLRLTADIWMAAARDQPLYVSFCDNNRVPAAAVAFSKNRNGVIETLDASGNWQTTQVPYFRDCWQRLTLVMDLDADKYDLLLNGYRLFVGGEGRDTSVLCTNAINKVNIETSGTNGDNGTFYIDNVTVEKLAANSPPTITTPATNPAVLAGQTLAITNTATDAEVPPQVLTWTLLSGPTNASLNSTSGVFTWRPTMAQAPLQTNIQVKVEDNGLPSFSDTQSFSVAVSLPARPRFVSSLISGEQYQFQIIGDAGPDYNIYTSTNLTEWDLLLSTNPAVLPFGVIAPLNDSQLFFHLRLGP